MCKMEKKGVFTSIILISTTLGQFSSIQSENNRLKMSVNFSKKGQKYDRQCKKIKPIWLSPSVSFQNDKCLTDVAYTSI